jgi:hypothetical protein
LLGAGVIAFFEFVRWVFGENQDVKQQFYARHREQLVLLALWALPMMVFSTATCITLPGYALNFFPAVAIVAGIAVWKFTDRIVARSGRTFAPLLAAGAVVGVNVAVFLAPAHWADRTLAGMPLSASHIRDNDRCLAEAFSIIRSQFRPEEVVICHRAEYFFWSFRHFQYHLPEYRNLLLVHDSSLPDERGEKFWLGLGKDTEFIDRLDVRPNETILLVVPRGESLSMFKKFFDISGAQEIEGTAGTLFAVRGAGY